jgi:membrane protein implicated in regulation of membrane protease activity
MSFFHKETKKPNWSLQTLLRYAMFQLPDLILLTLILIVVRRWIDFPSWIVPGVIAIWIVKNVVMFPFVWRLYDSGPSDSIHSMIGRQGTAVERLAPHGYVRIRNELWKAEVMGGRLAVEEGQRVRIRDIRGLVLLVEPADEERRA